MNHHSVCFLIFWVPAIQSFHALGCLMFMQAEQNVLYRVLAAKLARAGLPSNSYYELLYNPPALSAQPIPSIEIVFSFCALALTHRITEGEILKSFPNNTNNILLLRRQIVRHLLRSLFRSFVTLSLWGWQESSLGSGAWYMSVDFTVNSMPQLWRPPTLSDHAPLVPDTAPHCRCKCMISSTVGKTKPYPALSQSFIDVHL